MRSRLAGQKASGVDTGGALAAQPNPVHGDVRRVSIDSIVVPQRRIRRDLGDIDALALSLHLHGQLAPVIVYEVADQYHLIAGERRLEATRRLHEAQLKSGQAEVDATATISVIVRKLHAGEHPAEVELAENTQRRELNDEEEADALIRLVREGGREMREVAGIAGRSVAYVSKRVRMFEDPTLRAALTDGRISPAQAEELLSIAEEKRPEMLELALSAGWTSKDIREAVQTYANLPPSLKGEPDTQNRGRNVPGRADLDDNDDSDLDDASLDSDADLAQFRADAANIRILVERPRDLTRRIIELNTILQDLRPFQLKPSDDRALRQLWMTLRRLAQAPRVAVPQKFPSLAEAESVARRR